MATFSEASECFNAHTAAISPIGPAPITTVLYVSGRVNMSLVASVATAGATPSSGFFSSLSCMITSTDSVRFHE